MRVLLLSCAPERLLPVFGEDQVEVRSDPLTEVPDTDFIVSYGYRHIIREPILSAFSRKLVNIHIGMLPFNRGADPNFWSWFENTQKGITIHRIDAGIDTGDILLQKRKTWPDNARTLRSTYEDLQREAVKMFGTLWPMLKFGAVPAYRQEEGGSFHRSSDKDRYFSLLSRGWDSPVSEVWQLGNEVMAESQMTACAHNIYDAEVRQVPV